MSDDERPVSQIDDTISTVDDIPGSSISFSIRDNSIYVKEKPKPVEQPQPLPRQFKKEQWWLKKPTTQLDLGIQKKSSESKKMETLIFSPESNSSMKDFLDKENMCKKNEAERKDNENDTLNDILASVAFDKYQSDFENATDDDIGSILEEMSKMSEKISPSLEILQSASDILKQGDIKELLQEAEKLVQQNGNDLLKGVLKTEIIVPDQNSNASESLTRVRQLEVDIFKMIEEHTGQDDNANIKKNSRCPSVELLFENVNSPKTNKTPKKQIEEQKLEISSNSDLDDPVDIHSPSSVAKNEKKQDKKKDNLKKEITDVDKDFFDALIKRTQETAEQLSPRSLSFEKEDFTHFLKLLQDQSDREDNSPKPSPLQLVVDQFDPLKEKERQKEKELYDNQSKKPSMSHSPSVGMLELEKLSRENSQYDSSRDSSRRNSARSSVSDTKKVINDKNELYTVGLTPRLKLFADDIPKLLAEKSNETKKSDKGKQENEAIPKSESNEDFSFKNFKALCMFTNLEGLNDHKNVKDVKDFKDSQVFDSQKNLQNSIYLQNSPMLGRKKNSSDNLRSPGFISRSESKCSKNEAVIQKSRSFDQLSKSSRKLGSSLENIKNIKPVENQKPLSASTTTTAGAMSKKLPVPKIKVQPKTITRWNPKPKVTPKTVNKPMKPLQNEFSLNVKGSQIKPFEEDAKNSFGGGDWISTSKDYTLEALFQEEKQRFMHIKLELEAEIETYKSKLKDSKMMYEQEMFLIKKQNIMLKSKVDELMHVSEARSKYDPKIMSMQKELDRQENLIYGYEVENKKLIQEMKKLQNELKSSSQQKSKNIAPDIASSDQELLEKFKDLQEENVKINIEVIDLRQKNNDFSLKYEDVSQQNCLLQEELEMIKDQLRAKNDFITDRLQSMTTNELELRKQLEDLKVELHSKTEQLKLTKLDYERFQENVAPVEKELMDLRAKCTYFQEKLQTAKFNCEREKQLTLKLKDQVLLDNKNIMDLNRQVREMERILKRKNPDSVSALILTANSENDKHNAEKVKLLEERIMFLENEIKAKENMSQMKFMDMQKKFIDMKDKYSMQVSDLEFKTHLTQVEKKEFAETGTQTMHRVLESRGSEPNLNEKTNQSKAGPKSQNLKEDTHLIATIRGLKQEIINKDKSVMKLTKDLQEQQKICRKLQREREKLLSDRRKDVERTNNRVMTSSDSKLTNVRAAEFDEMNSNFYQNGHLHDTRKWTSCSAEMTETHGRLKKLSTENEVLKEELGRINKDFMALKNKRMQDLSLLQEEHEKEIALLIKDCNLKIDDNESHKLQGQINSQLSMINHLQQQIEQLQDYKEQVMILKTERDHLEGKNRTLNEKVKYLSTPSSQQLQILQDKLNMLQQRNETREMCLQKLVRDLVRSRSQGWNNCKNADDRSNSCYYRQEFDNIVGALQEITNLH